MRRQETVAENTSRLQRLKNLRDTLAQAIDSCESMRDLAALARQYRETLREIEEIEGVQSSGDEISEMLAQREAARKPGALRAHRAGLPQQ